MTKVSKLLASVAAFALAITGLTALPAQAADPYVVTEVKSGLDASADLVAANTRVYWKSGNQLWTSDGTTSLALHTFATSTSLSLTQASPQYTESGFFNYSTYINRAVTVGDTIYFWAADDNPMNTGTDAWNIWKSDGTVNGTVRVTDRYIDFFTPSGLDNPTSLRIAGNYIYYWDHFRDGFGVLTRNLNRLNLTSGLNEIVTGAPTNKPCDNQSGSSDQNQFEVIGSSLIFDYGDNMAMSGQDCINRIGALDLNTFSFTTITPISVGTELFSVQGPNNWTRLGNKIYFIGGISDQGYFNSSELWVTDGTVAGTQQVTNLQEPGIGMMHGVGNTKQAFMKPFTFGGYLYFYGWEDATDKFGIYRTNGTGSPELWLSGSVLTNLGARTNVPPQVINNGGTPYLIVDGWSPDTKQHMYAINMTTKAATLITPNASATDDSVGTLTAPWGATDYTAPITWSGKVWWLAKTEADNPGSDRNVFYTDGTAAGTGAATNFSGNLSNGIGYQGSGQVDQFADNATRPLVGNSTGVWFLRGPVWPGTTWSLHRITVNNVTPPPPPPAALTCSGQMTKLKVEAESATSLDPSFNKNTCEYSIKVDAKTSKATFTATFSPSSVVLKVGGTTQTPGPQTTKSFNVTLAASGTTTQVDYVWGTDTYRINIQRGTPAVSGAKDQTFTAPTLNGPVKTVDKDVQKKSDEDGNKKDVEVTIIGGGFDGKVAKVDEKGKKDETFAANVPAISGTVEKVKVDDEHRIIVAGKDVDGDKDVVRLKSDGSKDNSFSGPDLGSNKKVDDVEIQKDGKVIIVGDFGDNKNVKKLKDNGSEDQTFKNNLPVINDEVKTVKVQEDGKILIGGKFTDVGDNDGDKIARLEKDGKNDNSFKPATNGAHFNDDVEDIETQKDGKIIVVGKSNKDNENEADKVTRLKKDGKEDETFNFDGNIPSGKKVESVKVRDTGDIYIGGDFEDLGDDEGDKIAKVKKDGHVDKDFNPEHHDGDIHDIELEKHGKVFLGGEGSGDGDRVDKLEQDGDDTPRFDEIENDRSANTVPTGTKGQTKIHGDGFTPNTTVTIGGKPATVVSVDDRGEEMVVQVPAPDNTHKGDKTNSRKPADVVITVPGEDPITVPEAFGYVAKPEPQVIKPKGDHFNSDKDDEDKKGKVNDEEVISAYIPSGEPVVATSLTPAVCTVDDENNVSYLQRGNCKISVDAPATLGYADPAPVTEVIPVAGLDPVIVNPPLPDEPVAPEDGLQIPAPQNPAELPLVYTPVDPTICEVTTTGLVIPNSTSEDCQVTITTPGNNIYEPTLPATTPPMTIPHTAWIPPVTEVIGGVPVDVGSEVPNQAIPADGKITLGKDLGITYSKSKGTIIPSTMGVLTGPVKAVITYTWTPLGGTAVTDTCTVKWGILKAWNKLPKSETKKYKGAYKWKNIVSATACKLSARAKTALKTPGTTISFTSDVLRTRKWPYNYGSKYPWGETIKPLKRVYHWSITG